MTRLVNYLMSGPSHLPYLVVSLFTLRRHYAGPIEVCAFPESYGFAKEICKDDRIQAECVRWQPKITANDTYHPQLLERFRVMRRPGPEVRVYLDADTTIHDSIDPIFEAAAHYGLALTQHGNGDTTARVVRFRISLLRKFPAISRQYIRKLLRACYPEINGGVYGARPESKALETWERYSWEARSLKIPDEITANVLQIEFKKAVTVLGGMYNSSSKFLRDRDPKPAIIHFHGQMHCRPLKSPKSVFKWLPLYLYCLEHNVGRMREWKDMIPMSWFDFEITEEIKEKCHGRA